MRFVYCPACKKLRPYNWYARDKCETCGEEGVVINVERSVYGKLMYVLSAIVVVLIFLHVAWYQAGWQWASFYSVVPVDVSTWAIFGLIFVAIGLTVVDLSNSTKRAEQLVIKGIAKTK